MNIGQTPISVIDMCVQCSYRLGFEGGNVTSVGYTDITNNMQQQLQLRDEVAAAVAFIAHCIGMICITLLEVKLQNLQMLWYYCTYFIVFCL